MGDLKFKVGVVVSQPFDENAYLAFLEDRNDCLIVDPSFNTDEILGFLSERNLTPAAILNTHGHADHIAGNETLKRRWPDCPLIIGAGDASKLQDAHGNLSAPFGMQLLSPPADRLVHEGDRLDLAGFELEVRETPGHSQGHIVYVWRGSQPCVVFAGDLLMRRSVGRTDFPDGDTRQLINSIRTRMFDLPDDTLVLPGHGGPTTIGEEKRLNPFVGTNATAWDE